MLRCYEESLDRLLLPRGVADRAAQLIEKAGSRLAITDLRSAPAKLEVMFSGTLRAEQQVAVDAVAADELGGARRASRHQFRPGDYAARPRWTNHAGECGTWRVRVTNLAQWRVDLVV